MKAGRLSHVAADGLRVVLGLGLGGLLLAGYGCGGDGAGAGPEPVATGTVEVRASTTGPRLDPDGYTVHLGSRTRTVDVNGVAVFEEVEAGNHTIELSDIAANCMVVGETTVPVVVTAEGVVEVAFEVECASFIRVACPALELETATGLPLDEIPMGALPASFDLPVAAAVSLDGRTHEGLAFVLTDDPDDRDDPRLLVPLHPSTPLQGGAVSLTVSDGSMACAPVEFTIEPLPAADGEFQAVVDVLQQILTEQAAQFETTPEELVSGPPDELPRGLWPLAVAQIMLDHPANERSLRAVAEGALGDEVVVWLDRLLARMDVRARLETGPEASSSVPGASPLADASAFQCLPDVVSGSDASVLHECMEAAAEARRRSEGISERVAEDIGEALGAASELGLPVADVVGSVLGSVFWLIQSEREKAAALYPSRFTEMNVEVTDESFLEDEDDEGRVSYAEVYATSEGFDLLQEIIDGLEQALEFSRATGKFDFSTGTPADDVAAELAPMIEERLREMDIEELDIPPELFGPVDVTDPEWIQARAVGDAIRVVKGTIIYRPWLEGDATLSVRTFDGKFGERQIAEPVGVTVKRLDVDIAPEDVHLKPGEVQDFTVTVTDSKYPARVERDESIPLQGSVGELSYVGEGLHIVSYTAPAEPDYDDPDHLVVRHTAETGARANSTEERNATALIRFSDITISPRSACLEPGDTLRFNAEVEGLDDETVEWSADVGAIDDDGLYTAPPEQPAGGTATITARSASVPSVSDRVGIRIGGCSCRWGVAVEGRILESGPGDKGGFLIQPGASLFGIDLVDEQSGRSVTLTPATGAGGIPVGSTGAFPVTIFGNLGIGAGDLFIATGSQAPATLTLTENDGTVVEGSVTGSVDITPEDPFEDPRPASFDASFRIVTDGDPITDPTGRETHACNVEAANGTSVGARRWRRSLGAP